MLRRSLFVALLAFSGCSQNWEAGDAMEGGTPDGHSPDISFAQRPVEPEPKAPSDSSSSPPPDASMIDGPLSLEPDATVDPVALTAEAGSVMTPGLSLELPTRRISLVRGLTTDIRVGIKRSGSFAGDVLVSVANLPTGVTADPLTVSAGSDTAILRLRSTSTALVGGTDLTVTALGSGAPADNELLPLLVQDAAGTPDITFGTSGRFLLPLGTWQWLRVGFKGLALAADERIVLCGEARTASAIQFMVSRLTANGALDTGFGSGGFTTFNDRTTVDVCSAVTVLPSGAIAASGFSNGINKNHDGIITRFTSRGLLDTSFNGTGYVRRVAPNEEDSKLSTVVAQPDGKLVVSGFESYPNQNVLLLRLLSDGKFDNGFGDGSGRAIAQPGSATGLALQSTGGWVHAGPYDGINLALGRVTSNGAVDSTFGRSGAAQSPAASPSSAVRSYDVVVQRDDSLLVVGLVGPAAARDIAVARFTKDGQLDTSYGTGGSVIADYEGDAALGSAALHPDGSLLVAGRTTFGGRAVFSVIRFTPEGALDTSFGPGGRRTFDDGSARALVIDKLGRIVVAGRDTTETNVYLYRLWP